MKKLLSESKLRLIVHKLIKESSGYSNKVKIIVGNTSVLVEVANNDASRALGLMYRNRLEHNSGMLFIFEDVTPRSFWMKNTYLPLSIAYANEQGVILNISDMNPMTLERVSSVGSAKYALEMERGWFEKNGITLGDKIVY